MVENAFGIMAMRFRCLLTSLAVGPETVSVISEACLTPHNLMRLRYPGLQNLDLDQEDDDHQLMAGAWRDQAVMQEVEDEDRGPRATAEGKKLRVY